MLNKNTREQIGKRVTLYREQYDISRKVFTELFSSHSRKVTDSWIRNLEEGKAKISQNDLLNLDKILKTAPGDLNGISLVEMNLTDFLTAQAKSISVAARGRLSLTIEVSRTGAQSAEEIWLHRFLYEVIVQRDVSLMIFSRKKSYILSILILAIRSLVENGSDLNIAIEKIRFGLKGEITRVKKPNIETLRWFDDRVINRYIPINRGGSGASTSKSIHLELPTLLDNNPVSFYHYELIPDDNTKPDINLSCYSFANEGNFGKLVSQDSLVLSSRYKGVKLSSHFNTLTCEEIMENIDEKAMAYGIQWE